MAHLENKFASSVRNQQTLSVNSTNQFNNTTVVPCFQLEIPVGFLFLISKEFYRF